MTFSIVESLRRRAIEREQAAKTDYFSIVARAARDQATPADADRLEAAMREMGEGYTPQRFETDLAFARRVLAARALAATMPARRTELDAANTALSKHRQRMEAEIAQLEADEQKLAGAQNTAHAQYADAANAGTFVSNVGRPVGTELGLQLPSDHTRRLLSALGEA